MWPLNRLPSPAVKAHVPIGVLEAFAWGELDGPRFRRTLRHTRACSACRERFEWVRRLPAALERWPCATTPRDFSAVLERRARGDRVLLPVGAG